EGIVGAGSVIAVVVPQVEGNSPAEVLRVPGGTPKDRPAQWSAQVLVVSTAVRIRRSYGVRIDDAIQRHGNGIHVVIRVVAGEPVRTLASDISNFQRNARGQLTLNRDVISIHPWQSLLGR